MISLFATVWITGVIVMGLLVANSVARHGGWDRLAESLDMHEAFFKRFIVAFVLAWPVMLLLIMFTSPRS